jgi:hypothetical protein
MQNYIMLTQKNTYFSMHILFQELKQLLLFFIYKFMNFRIVFLYNDPYICNGLCICTNGYYQARH